MNKQDDLTLTYRNEIYTDCNLDLPDQANKSLKSLLERDIHKLKINPENENLITKFKESIQNIETIHNDPENLIHEKICDLKKQVNLEREKVNLFADSLIRYLEWYESDLKKDCKSSTNLKYYGQLVNKMKAQLNEYEKYLKSLNNTAEDTKNKNKEIQDAITNLENEIKDYEKKLFKNRCIRYRPLNSDFGIYFGLLSFTSFPNSDMGINGDSAQVINILDQRPISDSMLAAYLPQEQKQMLGERLYPLVYSLQPEWAGKITGMLLEIDNGKILHMLDSKEALKAKVDEAVDVLEGNLKINSNRKK